MKSIQAAQKCTAIFCEVNDYKNYHKTVKTHRSKLLPALLKQSLNFPMKNTNRFA